MPQAVLSINNPRPKVLEHNNNILHIRWLQDNQFGNTDVRNENNTAPSDICYFICERLMNLVGGKVHVNRKNLFCDLRQAQHPQRAADTPAIQFHLSAIFHLHTC